MATTQTTVFLSQSNQGDTAVRTSKQGVLEQTYSRADFSANTTVAFNAATGDATGRVPNPLGIFGETLGCDLCERIAARARRPQRLRCWRCSLQLKYSQATFVHRYLCRLGSNRNGETLLVIGTESGVVEL